MDDVIPDYQRQYGSIRVHVRVDAIFTSDVEEGQQRVAAYFSTRVHDVDTTQQLDLQRVACDLSAQADHWNARGSGFILNRITKFMLCISQYRSLHGSSYFLTPQWLAKKQAVINVKNTADSKCFIWSILAARHPGARNPNRLPNYKFFENALDISGLTFPLPVKDVPKFEKYRTLLSASTFFVQRR